MIGMSRYLGFPGFVFLSFGFPGSGFEGVLSHGAPTWAQVLDLVGAVTILVGAAFTLIGAAGLVRFKDLFSRAHAGAKPQLLGLMLMCFGLMLFMRSWQWLAICTLVLALQMVAAPIGSHLIGRAGYLMGLAQTDWFVVNDLDDDEKPRVDDPKTDSAD